MRTVNVGHNQTANEKENVRKTTKTGAETFLEKFLFFPLLLMTTPTRLTSVTSEKRNNEEEQFEEEQLAGRLNGCLLKVFPGWTTETISPKNNLYLDKESKSVVRLQNPGYVFNDNTALCEQC